jgi:N,N'-diacetyllegionaminate synthase
MTFFRGRHGPWLVAEIGGNHEGDFSKALQLTELAIDAGADAVKFQIYYGDTLVSRVADASRNQHFRKFELTPQQHLALAHRVRDAGRAYVASVWDVAAFDWIDPVISAYKIGSGDLTAVPLLRAAATTGKPLMLSTGLSDAEEVAWSVAQIRACHESYWGPDNLAVLQCTSMYPISLGDAQLSVMDTFRSLSVAVGYSDHTIGNRALEVAAAMGADVLEFHFTDNKSDRTFRDHQLSLDSTDLRTLIRDIEQIQTLKGSPTKQLMPVEIANNHPRSFRRAVYPSRDIASGEVLGPENLCVLRPNDGIDARAYDQLIGRRAGRPLKAYEPLDWAWIT